MSNNVYYDPADCGLEIFATLSEDLSYEFNILLVVKDKVSGKLFYAQDAGCSCPTPFEDFHYYNDGDTDMEPLNEHTLEAFKNKVKEFSGYGFGSISNVEKNNFVKKVEDYLKGTK